MHNGQGFDDTKRNHFEEKQKKKKSKKDLFENNHQRVTFLIEPNYYQAFEKIKLTLGDKKGYKTTVFNHYIDQWCDNTPVAKQLEYEGIQDVTDTYHLCTVLMNKKIYSKLEKILKRIGKHQGRERGIKTQIINDIMENMIVKESEIFGDGVKEVLSLAQVPILQKLFEKEKRA